MGNDTTMYEQAEALTSSQPSEINDIGPPPLPLNLREHKRAIAREWGLILLTSCVAPLVLYPALHWGANLTLKISLSIASAVLGVATLLSLGIRTWRLFKAGSDCRPLTSESRWHFDFFHWNYMGGFVLVTIFIVLGLTTTPEPSVRMVSLPPSILMVQVGFTLVLVGVFAKLGVQSPFPVSSIPKGSPFLPGVLVIIEDIIAVDGGLGREYRSALMERYIVSMKFRRLIEQLNWFWGFGAVLLGIALICIISQAHAQTFAFALGWVIPWIWAAVWAIITTYWVKSALRDEKVTWSENRKANSV